MGGRSMDDGNMEEKAYVKREWLGLQDEEKKRRV
jgi:hypothetical protein